MCATLSVNSVMPHRMPIFKKVRSCRSIPILFLYAACMPLIAPGQELDIVRLQRFSQYVLRVAPISHWRATDTASVRNRQGQLSGVLSQCQICTRIFQHNHGLHTGDTTVRQLYWMEVSIKPSSYLKTTCQFHQRYKQRANN
jgi:hypothetical protein